MNFDLNCDLGEGESSRRTRALMRHVTSVNVACGGHAGSARSMRDCIRLSREFGTRLGAHPGLWDRVHFGRRPTPMSAEALSSLLLHQVGALETLARLEDARLHHVKLHGALYHATENDHALRRAFLETMAQCWPKLKIYALAKGRVARQARRLGLIVWEEAFVDRAYQRNGNLLPRNRKGAVLTDTRQIQSRLHHLLKSGHFMSCDDQPVYLQPETLCLHADTANSVQLAAVCRKILES